MFFAPQVFSTALIAACDRKHFDVVEILLAYGADKEAKGNVGEAYTLPTRGTATGAAGSSVRSCARKRS